MPGITKNNILYICIIYLNHLQTLLKYIFASQCRFNFWYGLFNHRIKYLISWKHFSLIKIPHKIFVEYSDLIQYLVGRTECNTSRPQICQRTLRRSWSWSTNHRCGNYQPLADFCLCGSVIKCMVIQLY